MKVNVKILILLAAMVLSVGTGVWAKDKGTPVKMTNWGVVYVPDDVYWQEGNQPMLTASSYDNDVVTMLEQIYPLEPATYQVVQKDGGIFRYGYVARYSAFGKSKQLCSAKNKKTLTYGTLAVVPIWRNCSNKQTTK